MGCWRRRRRLLVYGNGRERRVNQSVVILGSTGSVGNSALDVIRANRSRYRVVGLAANNNLDALSAQCAEFSPHTAVLANEMRAEQLAAQLASQVSTNQVTSQSATNQVSTNQSATTASNKVDASNDSSTRVEGGDAAVCRLASSGADIVICAIVGAAGLPSTWAAVQQGNKVLIANKEPLVMLGRALIDEARAHNSVVIPLDSEHNAIFQCLPTRAQAAPFDSLGDCGVRRIWLTASGGPLRELTSAQMARVTPQQACAHPNWSMGRKISVDSATMMNKGLELIEACALFGLSVDEIEVVIHPQSVVHSLVEYADGSTLAQLGCPDMRVPIANALGWPARIESGAPRLQLTDCARLDFAAPDETRFPALPLARQAAREGGTMPAVMNAANEIAVHAFLQGALGFDRIIPLVDSVMQAVGAQPCDLQSALEADRVAREHCRALVGRARKSA